MVNDPKDLEYLFSPSDEIPAEFLLHPDRYTPCYLLNGAVRPWKGPLTSVMSPIGIRAAGGINLQVIGYVPAMDERNALNALDAACGAWHSGRGMWPQMDLTARANAVKSFLTALMEARDEIAHLLMWEVGKSIDESRAEVDRTVEYIRLTIEALGSTDDTRTVTDRKGSVFSRVKPAPVGVCLLMGPYNNPVYETYTMVIPAILMGNTVVVKAPKFGRMVHQILFPSLAGAFPPGVVNFIYGGPNGVDTASAIMEAGRVDLFSFIGSAAGAAALIDRHPYPLRLRTVLSLDAKNPALITADADIDSALRECVVGSLAFNGQRCTALKILFVHQSRAEEFLSPFSAAVDSLPLGMPWKKDVKITPLPEPGKVAAMTAYMEDARVKGASVINHGGAACCTLFSPAVIYPVPPEALLYRKEQFGPVVPVCPYRDDQEFFDYVASSNYGQQISIFGTDPEKISALVRELENQVGRININSKCQRGPDMLPFAGRKDSGMTTLSIRHTLRAFSLPSVVTVRSGAERYL